MKCDISTNYVTKPISSSPHSDEKLEDERHRGNDESKDLNISNALAFDFPSNIDWPTPVLPLHGHSMICALVLVLIWIHHF